MPADGRLSYDPAPPMPVRATKRGAARTPLTATSTSWSAAPRSPGSRSRASCARRARACCVLDRCEIGERQTSACAAPTEWLRNLGLEPAIRQTFGSLVLSTRRAHRALAARLDVLDVRLRRALRPAVAQHGAGTEFETAKVNGRTATSSHADRGDVRAPLIVDALGWKPDPRRPPRAAPEARLSRGLEVHPGGRRRRPRAVDRQVRDPRGLRLVVPARMRCASASARSTRTTTSRSRRCGWPATVAAAGWLPGQLDPAPAAPAVGDGIFFVGDSAGHCLPLTAEGIRTAFYFGVAAVVAPRGARRRPPRAEALAHYDAFSASHRWKYACMLQSSTRSRGSRRAGSATMARRFARRPRPLGVPGATSGSRRRSSRCRAARRRVHARRRRRRAGRLVAAVRRPA